MGRVSWERNNGSAGLAREGGGYMLALFEKVVGRRGVESRNNKNRGSTFTRKGGAKKRKVIADQKCKVGGDCENIRRERGNHQG